MTLNRSPLRLFLAVAAGLCAALVIPSAAGAVPNAPDPSPVTNGTVYATALSTDGSTLYVGGDFTQVDGVARKDLAAINVADGSLTSFDPEPDAPVLALAVSGSTLYAGGSFTHVGATAESDLAAIDTVSGAAVAGFGDPALDGPVDALLVSGSTLYAGGSFTTAGGQPHANLAAFDTSGSVLGTFANGQYNNGVDALALAGGNLYVGGMFTAEGTSGTQGRLIAVNPTTDAPVTTFMPTFDNGVYSILPSGSSLIVGGTFTTLDGVQRHEIGSVDATSGAVGTFDPEADGQVLDIQLSSGILYVAGLFSHIGGQARPGVAALDPASGLATSFAPVLGGGAAYSVTPVSDSKLEVGGTFTTVNGTAHQGLAAFTGPTTPLAEGAPTVTGTPTVGSALTCHLPGFAGSAATATYAWDRDGAAIAGASAPAYTVTTADQGHSLTCVVTATNTAGSVSATSAAIPVVAAVTTTVPPAPKVTYSRETTAGTLSGLTKTGIVVTVQCTAACRTLGRVFMTAVDARRLGLLCTCSTTHKPVLVGNSSIAVTKAGTFKIRVKLTANARKYLARRATTTLVSYFTTSGTNTSKTIRVRTVVTV